MTNLSTENEQLADWLEQYDKDWIGTKGKDLTARLNRIATLIRQQSARIAALEDALRDIAEMTEDQWLSREATEALGKGSE